MTFRAIIAGGLSLCAVSCISADDGPTSSARSAAFPDLTILGITYAYDHTYPGWTSIDFTLRIQNIGMAPFDSLLYVSWTGSKEAVRGGYYTRTALVNYDPSGPSVKGKPIVPGDVIQVAVSSSYAMLDTNIVRFRIMTDRKGMPGEAGRDLPLIDESNYDNNAFTLLICRP